MLKKFSSHFTHNDSGKNAFIYEFCKSLYTKVYPFYYVGKDAMSPIN